MTLPNSRVINSLGVIGAIGSMLFAMFYLEHHLGLEPCPLCMLDRLVVITLGITYLLAFAHNPGRTGQRLYGLFGILAAAIGIALAARHIWLQNLPSDQIPECAPGLDYMLDTFPIADTLRIILTSSGECAEIAWRFLGMSIPTITLLLFLGFLLLSLIQTVRKHP